MNASQSMPCDLLQKKYLLSQGRLPDLGKKRLSMFQSTKKKTFTKRPVTKAPSLMTHTEESWFLKTLNNLDQRSSLRAIFTWLSKVICIYFGFVLLHSVIGLKNSHNFLNQSQVKPKPIVTCLRKFSRPVLYVIALSFDWTMDCSVSFVIGQNNYFGFGFMIDTQLKTALAQHSNFTHDFLNQLLLPLEVWKIVILLYLMRMSGASLIFSVSTPSILIVLLNFYLCA